MGLELIGYSHLINLETHGLVFLSEVVKKLRRLLETNLNRHLFNAELEGGGSVMVDFTVVSQKEGPIFKSLATRGPPGGLSLWRLHVFLASVWVL